MIKGLPDEIEIIASAQNDENGHAEEHLAANLQRVGGQGDIIVIVVRFSPSLKLLCSSRPCGKAGGCGLSGCKSILKNLCRIGWNVTDVVYSTAERVLKSESLCDLITTDDDYETWGARNKSRPEGCQCAVS